MIKIIKRLLKNIFGIHSPTKEWTKIPVEYNEKDTRYNLYEHEYKGVDQK